MCGAHHDTGNSRHVTELMPAEGSVLITASNPLLKTSLPICLSVLLNFRAEDNVYLRDLDEAA